MSSSTPEPEAPPEAPIRRPDGDETHNIDGRPNAHVPNSPNPDFTDAELGGMPDPKVPRKPARPERKLSPETKAVADRIVANFVPPAWRLPGKAAKDNSGRKAGAALKDDDSESAQQPDGKNGDEDKPATGKDDKGKDDKGKGGSKGIFAKAGRWLLRRSSATKSRGEDPKEEQLEPHDARSPLAFQILDIIGWQETGGEAAALGWLLKSEQAEAVARMQSLQRLGILVGGLAAALTLAAAGLAMGAWWIVQDRTGIGCGNHEFFNIPEALWGYSLSSGSAVLLCLAAATLLFRVARALFADAAAAFATSDGARRAEASVRFLRLAETIDAEADGKIRDGMIALGLEFGRRTPSAKATPEEIGTQIGEALDLAEKVKNLVKQ